MRASYMYDDICFTSSIPIASDYIYLWVIYIWIAQKILKAPPSKKFERLLLYGQVVVKTNRVKFWKLHCTKTVLYKDMIITENVLTKLY